MQRISKWILLLALVAAGFGGSPALARDQWSPFPLRTGAQLKQGLPGGEGMQQIQCLAYAPSNPEVAYLGVDTSQIWKSADGGKSWRWSGEGLPTHGVRSLAIDPRSADVVFAAGFHGEPFERSRNFKGAAQGIYKTSDGGKSWRLLRQAAFSKGASSGNMLALTGTGGEWKLYAATQDAGLLVSLNGGESWREAPFQRSLVLVASEAGLFLVGDQARKIGAGLPSQPLAISASAKPKDMVYASCGPDGIYVSTDRGEHFQKASPFTALPNAYHAVSASPLDGMIAYTMADKPQSSSGIQATRDGGASWKMPASVDPEGLLPMGKLGQWRHGPVAPHPVQKGTALAGVNGYDIVARTEDGGETWRYSASGYSGGRMTAMAFPDEATVIMALTDFGLWRSTDRGRSFTNLPAGRLFGHMSSNAVSARGGRILSTLGSWNEKGVAVSDDGSAWRTNQDFKGDIRFVTIHAKNPDILYAGQFRSDDGGKSWKRLPCEARGVFPGDSDILFGLAASGAGVQCQRSRDRGETWQPLGPVLAVTLKEIRAMAVDPKSPDRIWLATAKGVASFKGGAWTLAADRQGLALDRYGQCFVECLAVDPHRPDVLYAGRRSLEKGPGNGVFRSGDGGLSWSEAGSGLPSFLEVWGLAISPFDGSVYAGTSLGTFRLPGSERSDR
jgi:photosystem II stability/assembly factor-like uncharacterized protein